ncbi:MAG: hypothetical protein HC892_17650 [Saprospiraceae bacterium]|nr:hypothetical protein [Saprospiraceae bacterium]
MAKFNAEPDKIRKSSMDIKGNARREWKMLEKIVTKESMKEDFKTEIAYTYLGTLLGRTYNELLEA